MKCIIGRGLILIPDEELTVLPKLPIWALERGGMEGVARVPDQLWGKIDALGRRDGK